MQKDDVTGLYLPTDKDFPLEARVRHLEALIGKLDASKETDPDAASATLLALLRGLLATIAAIKGNDGIKKIADAVTVDGLNALATESTLGEVKSALDALGATSDAAETDPAETASQIALLKGMLTGLNTVAGTVDNGAAKVTLTGHVAEELVSRMPSGISHRETIQVALTDAEFTNTVSVLNTTNPCVIESITLTSTTEAARLYVTPRDEAGQLGTRFRLPRSVTSATMREVQISDLQKHFNGKTTVWEIFKYDSEGSSFAMGTRIPIPCPTGVSVTLASGAYNHAIAIELSVLYFVGDAE